MVLLFSSGFGILEFLPHRLPNAQAVTTVNGPSFRLDKPPDLNESEMIIEAPEN